MPVTSTIYEAHDARVLRTMMNGSICYTSTQLLELKSYMLAFFETWDRGLDWRRITELADELQNMHDQMHSIIRQLWAMRWICIDSTRGDDELDCFDNPKRRLKIAERGQVLWPKIERGGGLSDIFLHRHRGLLDLVDADQMRQTVEQTLRTLLRDKEHISGTRRFLRSGERDRLRRHFLECGKILLYCTLSISQSIDVCRALAWDIEAPRVRVTLDRNS